MIIFYYIDYKGNRIGSVNNYKIAMMAEQNHITTGIRCCDISQFNNVNDILHGREWL